MSISRRDLLKGFGLAALLAPGTLPSRFVFSSQQPIRPKRLKAGDTVGLINPAGITFESLDIEIVAESLQAMGLKTKSGTHLRDRYGYLAGKDQDRAADVNTMFADSSVDAILSVRGGWGCNRILPLLDYDLIRNNPKIIVGYSDITSLLIAISVRAGLITFHGPVGTSTWNQFSVDCFKRILFDGELVTLRNPQTVGDNLVQTKERIQTITRGKARGRLIGGNLSVLAAMVGSAFLPDWKGRILFLEDDGEFIRHIDRMLTQLKLAGILGEIAGFVFGKCTNCSPGEVYGSLTLEEVLADHIKPLGIPAWSGAMIGHIENKFTVPIGVDAEIDAEAGTIRMLEAAVR